MVDANETPEVLRRTTPAWLVSIGIHAGFLLLAGAFWVVQQLEEVKTVVISSGAVRPDMIFPLDLDAREDVHEPIVPKEFQPDAVIINDAFRVVENTIPKNEQTPRVEGDSLEFVSDRPFRGQTTYDVSSGAGGGGGRYGFPSRPAGFG